MRRLARLGPRGALVLAAALVAVSLGLVWHATTATTGYQMPGYTSTTLTHNWYTGGLDLTPVYMPGYHTQGDPTDGARGFEAPVRLVLAPALAALVWVVARPTPIARRTARCAAYGLVVCALIAVSDRYVVPMLVSSGSAALILWALNQPVRTRSTGDTGPDAPPSASAF